MWRCDFRQRWRRSVASISSEGAWRARCKEPRATNDIDIVVAMMPHRIGAFVKELGPDFEVDVESLRDALVRGSCANIFYLPLVTKIDIFALGGSRYDEAEFNRRRKVKVRSSGEELYVKAPEIPCFESCYGTVKVARCRRSSGETSLRFFA